MSTQTETGQDASFGYDAMGEPVPAYRKQEADKHLEAMIPDIDYPEKMRIVGQMSTAIEKDNPYQALKIAEEKLDYYGARRLFAALCAAPKPEDEA